MNNYLIQKNKDYGIYQTDRNMAEVKMLFDEGLKIEKWEKLEQIQRYAQKEGLNYVGFDSFYK